MKKIIRLTESDLERLVKKVLKEQSSPTNDNMKSVIEDCFKKNLDTSDMKKLPTCMVLATEIFTTKKIPTDVQKQAKCANEIANNLGEDVFTAFEKIGNIGRCLIHKLKKPPVMY